ncbi:hypothetical protein PHET_10704 [Paragonimus heterotremus]|uniref:Uncharacterized protein n=1 Tax=Paragonimus heterotremus TaxID=100268 RepID=A0A8J4SJU1_9TREM|nr:hypothetical protein PHET_10704 [Paragonimus heterotremus]
MFWTSFAEPYLANDLLNQPDLTIQQLLDDNNILQRCREKDVRLVDFYNFLLSAYVGMKMWNISSISFVIPLFQMSWILISSGQF